MIIVPGPSAPVRYILNDMDNLRELKSSDAG